MHRKRRQKKRVKLELSTSPVVSADLLLTESISPGRQNNGDQDRIAESPVVVHQQSYLSYWCDYLSSTTRQALAYASSAAGSLTSFALEQVSNQISRVAEVVSEYSSQSMANATEVTRYLLDPTVFPDDLNQSVDLSATLGTNKKEEAQVAVESVPRPLLAAEQGSHKTLTSRRPSALPIKPMETSVLVVPQPQRSAPSIYDLFNIEPTVDFPKLRKIYLKEALLFHPDKAPVEGFPEETVERWKQKQSAWDQVNTKEKLVDYYKQLQENRIEGLHERLPITEAPVVPSELGGVNLITEQAHPLPSSMVVEIAPSPAPNPKEADLKAQEEAARKVVVEAEVQDWKNLQPSDPHPLKQVGPTESAIIQKPTQSEIVRKAAVKDPVIGVLEGYIKTRKRQNEYTGWGRSLTGTSKTVKLEAAKALLDYLKKPDKTKHFQPTQEQYNALIEPFSKLKDIADKVLREIERTDKLAIIPQPEKRGIWGIKETLSRLKQRVGAALENKIKGPSNHK